jgi:diguanylate cyclase (GGDEF)-like protein
MRILIAEDDSVSSLVLRTTLEKQGHEILVAVDGFEAWQHVERGKIRLVISDWTLARMDGLEFCRRVRCRTSASPSYVYVILVTSRAQVDDRIEALEAGADDLLVKPLEVGELMARVRVALRILTMQEELEERSRALERAHAELTRRNARLAEAAVRDSLTGLSNRRHFRERFDSGFSFAVRQRLPLSLVMLDVDHFKAYNDAFGHPAGDRALIELAQTLRDSMREHELVARYGGEEFVILLPATAADAARKFCERLRDRVASHPWPLRPITASFGIATLNPCTLTPAQLLEEADRALYRSKQLGRNRVMHFQDLHPSAACCAPVSAPVLSILGQS